jgi:hypothetical protein
LLRFLNNWRTFDGATAFGYFNSHHHQSSYCRQRDQSRDRGSLADVQRQNRLFGKIERRFGLWHGVPPES